MACANTRGVEIRPTKHAIDRYSERCPGGPGIQSEMQASRTCGRLMYKKIRKKVPVAVRQGRIGRDNSPYTHWISPQNTIFVTHPITRGVVSVITCWKYEGDAA